MGELNAISRKRCVGVLRVCTSPHSRSCAPSSAKRVNKGRGRSERVRLALAGPAELTIQTKGGASSEGRNKGGTVSGSSILCFAGCESARRLINHSTLHHHGQGIEK